MPDLVDSSFNIKTTPPTRPIYMGKRKFLGLKDLVVSFYAQKCQFQCTYCNLPVKSHPDSLSADSIKEQIDWVFSEFADSLSSFQQFSVGNEGSIIDQSRFPAEAMDYLLERTRELTALEVLSLETRPEYISVDIIQHIRQRVTTPKIDVTIGFETQDDHLREVILKKSIRKKNFESKVKLLGELGVRLTCYVLLKPSPTMTEEEGISEAVASIEYLANICQQHGVELVIYLNPVYAAKGTPLAEAFRIHNYKPVRIQSVVEVIAEAREFNVPIYTGLWTESNAFSGGDYTIHPDYRPEIREAIRQYNLTQDFNLLTPYITQLKPDLLGEYVPLIARHTDH
ncbi:radical SAM protein [Beggiatoa leptomitoformis]|uniref:Radical SAM protein n=1 Tax=Beggiatoa leptomitoformis TaxID=288004 RepID=A0A2N9YF77_9GAMM|nr:radical SAM protein [Beggiatoa leptomitoformis]ALG68492.1 radical SAM protein [Beggiatoa leptomitoformis]AUI69171.1 radical SAM protein [Beggiatoa leptomitoformis]